MVDKSRLQIIGWLFGGMTGAVMLVAAFLVSEAVASNPHAAAGPAAIAADIR